MGVAMFMKVDGVTGESADAQHKGWTDIQSFTWGASQPGAMASGSGGNAGKASFNDLVVSAYMDKGAPAIIKNCANGKHLSSVEISACKTGGTQVEFMRVTLQEVLVTSAQVAGIDPGDVADRLMMHYGFQAAKVKKQYWQQNDNGGKGAEVTVGWNIKENTEM
ncbi:MULTISPECIES: Hcp family type VI secretion system effector [Burkholderia]|uniref:Hcp family type VI secretion system effector n=1 Tax=Burkholderia TaxID=32008 RepID=UPI00128B432A|nr:MULTISPECIES: type VI secretion system tube protein Hcp [Burkholderia]HKT63104.1 type VI secretion system tube protein Hcp [Burkholderia sp.]MCU9955702.1 type VI secretion system tube protein Hcp [Burkholderia sp. BKH01]MPV71588.1 type VI secretion system tube protein Hcp [Burkholderia sp. BE17]NTY36587.1 type VI secretion system tube protein Hcp [Burkholderia diffusa]UOB59077.1 type VI secretion system tube protein Hcp [Burkholderia pyrrocinia]